MDEKADTFFCSTGYHKKLSCGIANEVEMIKTKRIYDQKEDSDGTRILYYLPLYRYESIWKAMMNQQI